MKSCEWFVELLHYWNFKMNDLERVVMNSIRCAQNISQSFSHSIQLCDDDSDSSAEVDTALSARITAFLERIGKYVFPQVTLHLLSIILVR